jgi:hypothetical protein
MSSYVLRSYCFGYNDECFYVCGWQIGKIFDNREEAESTYRKLQLQYLRALDLSEHEYVFDGEQEYLEKIDGFLFEKTGKHVLEGNYVDSQRDLHTELSDDDLLAFGDFAEMHAFKLIEFDDEPVFYALYDPRENEFVKYYDESFEGLVYGNSQDEVNKLIAQYAYGTDYVGRGSLEALSDNPVLLKQLIDSSKGVNHSPSKKKLTLSYHAENAAAINELLKEPIFEIREMDAQAIKKIEDEIMEELY